MTERSIESIAGQRAVDLPNECRVRLQTLTGPHRQGEDGNCVTCGFPFVKSTLPLYSPDPLSGYAMKGLS